MAPRSFYIKPEHRWKAIARARVEASDQATRDQTPKSLVELDGRIWVRSLERGRAMCDKHRDAKFVEEVHPEVTA